MSSLFLSPALLSKNTLISKERAQLRAAVRTTCRRRYLHSFVKLKILLFNLKLLITILTLPCFSYHIYWVSMRIIDFLLKPIDILFIPAIIGAQQRDVRTHYGHHRVGRRSSCKRALFTLSFICGSGPVVHICSIPLLPLGEASASPSGSTPRSFGLIQGFLTLSFICSCRLIR